MESGPHEAGVANAEGCGRGAGGGNETGLLDGARLRGLKLRQLLAYQPEPGVLEVAAGHPRLAQYDHDHEPAFEVRFVRLKGAEHRLEGGPDLPDLIAVRLHLLRVLRHCGGRLPRTREQARCGS